MLGIRPDIHGILRGKLPVLADRGIAVRIVPKSPLCGLRMAWMNLAMQLKLLPTPKQADAMLRTMERFNAACDALAAVAFANR